MLRYIGIIPARYASTRFPGKPLVDVLGKPMIQRVYEQASQVLQRVVVATDDTRIFECVREFGGEVVMTRSDHKSGTDRCYEAYCKIGEEFDVIVNIQGDEPFIHPSQIESLKHCFDEPSTAIATLVRPFPENCVYEVLANPNTPKVVVDASGHALLFSRSVIPYQRGVERDEWSSHYPYMAHVGIYAYRSEVLNQITQLPQSSLEIAESLEQLRWLQAGFCIGVAQTLLPTYGIDTPEDLKRIVELKKDIL